MKSKTRKCKSCGLTMAKNRPICPNGCPVTNHRSDSDMLGAALRNKFLLAPVL